MSFRFSIVIPVYNVAPYLRECLDSVLMAAKVLSSPVEIVCVDDGSTDGSGTILNEYAEKVSVIHQKNAGVSAARNVGLAQATGEYICFVDADDTVDEEWLVEYAKAIARTGADLIRIGNEWKFFEGEALKDWLWKEVVQNGYNWKYAIRREIAQKATFPAGVAYCEDSLYTMQLVPHIRKAVQLSKETYGYRIRGDSAMRASYRSEERVLFLRALRRNCEENPSYDRRIVSRCAFGGALLWMARPRDVVSRRMIRVVLAGLKDEALIDSVHLKRLDQIEVFLFLRFGWIWPTWGMCKLIAVLVRIKHFIEGRK